MAQPTKAPTHHARRLLASVRRTTPCRRACNRAPPPAFAPALVQAPGDSQHILPHSPTSLVPLSPTTPSSWHQLQASPRRPTWLVLHEEQRHYENVLQSHKKRGLAEISWPVAGSPIIYSCSGTPSLQTSSYSWPQHCCSRGCASSLHCQV